MPEMRSDDLFAPEKMSHVVQILISESPSAAMASQESAYAIPGKGLQGDRYFVGVGTFTPHPHKPDYELTLIEKEKIDAFASESGLPFTSHDARRNIVTEGVDLNALAGKRFLIGKVLIRGIRLCEPCNHLAKATFPETLPGLVHKAGLRAEILTEGTIRVGDKIVEQA
jgi:MOSC domain-containing protein YiiM